MANAIVHYLARGQVPEIFATRLNYKCHDDRLVAKADIDIPAFLKTLQSKALPADRPVTQGECGKDWLIVVVQPRQFASRPREPPLPAGYNPIFLNKLIKSLHW